MLTLEHINFYLDITETKLFLSACRHSRMLWLLDVLLFLLVYQVRIFFAMLLSWKNGLQKECSRQMMVMGTTQPTLR